MNNNLKQPRPEYKSDKCEVRGRYFVVGGQMAGYRHILTGLVKVSSSNYYIWHEMKMGLFLSNFVFKIIFMKLLHEYM